MMFLKVNYDKITQSTVYESENIRTIIYWFTGYVETIVLDDKSKKITYSDDWAHNV